VITKKKIQKKRGSEKDVQEKNAFRSNSTCPGDKKKRKKSTEVGANLRGQGL